MRLIGQLLHIYLRRLKEQRVRYFSPKWPAIMQIYWNKKKRFSQTRVQLSQGWLEYQHGRPFYFFETPLWPP